MSEQQAAPQQSYAVLTLCRALFTDRHGRYVSKEEAADWVQGELPEWTALIEQALRWRIAAPTDAALVAATFPQTERFVQTVRAMMATPGNARGAAHSDTTDVSPRGAR